MPLKWGRDLGRGLGPQLRSPSVPPRQPWVLVLELKHDSRKVNLSALEALSAKWAQYTHSYKTTTALTCSPGLLEWRTGP